MYTQYLIVLGRLLLAHQFSQAIFLVLVILGSESRVKFTRRNCSILLSIKREAYKYLVQNIC